MRIDKPGGGTPTERLLSTLCEKTFLKLWSWPNPRKDDGKESLFILNIAGGRRPSPSRRRNLVLSNEPHARWGNGAEQRRRSEEQPRQRRTRLPSLPNALFTELIKNGSAAEHVGRVRGRPCCCVFNSAMASDVSGTLGGGSGGGRTLPGTLTLLETVALAVALCGDACKSLLVNSGLRAFDDSINCERTPIDGLRVPLLGAKTSSFTPV